MNEHSELTVVRSGIAFTSGSTAQICAAMALAQGEFETPKRTKPVTVRTKDGDSYKFMYAPLEEIIDACKAALAKNGIYRQQLLIRAESGRYELRTVLWHSSGEFIGNDYPVFYQREGAQGFASGVTYARRYGLSLLLGIAPEDDDDANTAEGNHVVQPAKPQQSARKPKPPADNPMMPPYDPQTGEVVEQPPKQIDEDHALMMDAARKGLKNAQDLFKKFPLHVQQRLQPNVQTYLRLAKEFDEAHKMAAEMQEGR